MENRALVKLLTDERDHLIKVVKAIDNLLTDYRREAFSPLPIDKTKEVHIGHVIRAFLFEKSPLSATELANRLGITRAGIYKIFEKSDISTSMLQKISAVLNHNFFQYYID